MLSILHGLLLDHLVNREEFILVSPFSKMAMFHYFLIHAFESCS